MVKGVVAAIGTSRLVLGMIFGLACFAAAELGFLLSYQGWDRVFVTFWPPAGLLLAALVLCRNSSWPSLLLGAFAALLLSNLLNGKSLPVSLGYCGANCGEAWLGAWLLVRSVGRPLTLSRMKEVLALAGLGAFASTILGAAAGAAIVTWAQGGSYLLTWQRWWVADALGVLVVAPVILAWAARGTGIGRSAGLWRTAEAALVFLGVGLAAEAVYGDWLPTPLTIPAYALPFLLWAGLRLGPSGAAAAVVVVALIAIANTAQERGPYASLATQAGDRLLRGQATLLVISLSVLMLAAIVAERDRAEQQTTKVIGELAQALAEIKTLRGLIPICAWCKKIRDDRGFWRRLEEYLCAHTEAEFTHGSCPDCLNRNLVAAGREPLDVS
jgi:integral membrane sensor domain MASE1